MCCSALCKNFTCTDPIYLIINVFAGPTSLEADLKTDSRQSKSFHVDATLFFRLLEDGEHQLIHRDESFIILLFLFGEKLAEPVIKPG